MERGTSEDKPKKGGLFDDLSATQVIAGALAAVTSMLLASQIGIAGSVIGVAVGSIVSTVASQLYKKFLAASADRLRDLNPVEAMAPASSKGIGAKASAVGDVGNRDGRTVELGLSSQGKVASAKAFGADGGDGSPAEDVGISTEETAVLDPAVLRTSHTPSIDDSALQGDATVIKAQSMRKHKRKLQRRVAAVAVVSALAAVVVSAFLVNAVTDGQGFGAKVSTIPYAQSNQTDQGESSDGDAGSDASRNDGSQDNGGSSTEDASKDKDSSAQDNGSTGSNGDNQSGSANPSNPSGGTGGEQGSGTGSGGSSGDGSSDTGGNQGTDSGSGTGSGTGSDGGQGSGSGSAKGSSANSGQSASGASATGSLAASPLAAS